MKISHLALNQLVEMISFYFINFPADIIEFTLKLNTGVLASVLNMAKAGRLKRL